MLRLLGKRIISTQVAQSCFKFNATASIQRAKLASSTFNAARRSPVVAIDQVVPPAEVTPQAGSLSDAGPKLTEFDLNNLPCYELKAWIDSFPGGHRVGMIDLDPTVFGEDLRIDLLQRAVVWQRAKWRKGFAKTKDRAEVRGGGRKPWQQKGTGRARASTIRSPLFRGGGVVHGPKPKDWSFKLPRKVRRFAMRVALSTKYAQDDLIIVDGIEMVDHKTKSFVKAMDAHGVKSALIIYGHDEDAVNIKWASRNADKFYATRVTGLKVYQALKYETLILTTKAVRDLEEKLRRPYEDDDVEELKTFFANLGESESNTEQASEDVQPPVATTGV